MAARVARIGGEHQTNRRIVTSRSSNPLWYVYGIVRAAAARSSTPAGLDDVSVSVEPSETGDIAALVSLLDGPEYEASKLESQSGNVDWISPRAIAHDRVLTWASDQGAVVPLPMFSLFSGRAAVHDMLRERAAQLDAALTRIGDAREYALRVYRVDSELLASITSLSPRLRDVAVAAEAASPGQRYLLERKLEGEKRAELRAVTQQLVDELVAELSTHAVGVERSPIPRVSDAESTRGTMVLNAAFLVAPSSYDTFRRTLSSVVERRSPQGLRFDFTGPWPPYHFVNERANDD